MATDEKRAPTPPGTAVTDPFTLDLPRVDDNFEPGQPLWAVYPSGDPAVWTLGKVRYVEPSGRFRIAVAEKETHELPTSFVRAAAPAEGLSPGLPVLVNAEGAARFGRVQSISRDQVRVKYALDRESLQLGAFTATDVLTLGRRDLQPGSPVLFSSGGSFFIGTLGAVTGKQAYVLCGDLLELGRTEVTALDTSKLLGPGDRVVAVPEEAAACEALDGEVVEMKAGGMLYRVELAGGKMTDVPYAMVAPHPSVTPPSSP
jgi:hypothetical protein